MFLRDLRKAKKIKAIDVYNALGIDKHTLKKLEEGKTSLRADWIPQLSLIYNIEEKEIYEKYIEERSKLDGQ
ncbi:MAG: XRE family transcriptional regulator [Bacilli bacterium]